MSGEDGESLGDMGERAFAKICDKFGYEYLHIRQEPDEYSSKMWQTGQKRPDFLVNIPDITSLFVDVKVRGEKRAGDKSEILSNLPAFSVDISDFQRMKELESDIRISTWYAFFKMIDSSDIYRAQAYLIPLSQVEKHIPEPIRKRMQDESLKVKWEIRIPFHCMNEWNSSTDLMDKCQGCSERYCKEYPK